MDHAQRYGVSDAAGATEVLLCPLCHRRGLRTARRGVSDVRLKVRGRKEPESMADGASCVGQEENRVRAGPALGVPEPPPALGLPRRTSHSPGALGEADQWLRERRA